MRTPEELVGEFVRAFEARDLDGFLGCFAADATAAFPFSGEPQRGRHALRERFSRYLADIATGAAPAPPPVTLDDLVVQRLGPDASVALFTYGRPREIRRRTLVLRREGGRWWVVHLHGSNAPA
ncbi:MAG TPA: nuclear transport factor 2 family protein [Candidatus Limnocylindria bacterium]|nr:nuclear transport factor 2 family protein [Candidatus Limnocylindria bacterium]